MEGKDSFLVSIIQLILSIFTNMKKNEYRLLGIMSGTSLDGVDLVFTELSFSNATNFKIIYSETIPYSEKWLNRLKNSSHLEPAELNDLDQYYTKYLSEVILKFIAKYDIDLLDAICSHGHTVKHRPDRGLTFQIGNLPKLSTLTGVPVVCDFRVQDVELGGQGAPLVPIGDRMLFSNYKYCINLGGFANISEEVKGQRIAYDVCAVNTVLNHYVRSLDKDFDEDGNLARTGKVNLELLEQLNALKYFQKTPPKSLGIEWVDKYVLPLIDSYSLEIPDILRTFSEHIAIQIAACLKNASTSEILLTGGGTFNSFLIERFRSHSDGEFVIPKKEIIDYKEALIFALLGALKLRGEINVLSSVTGAKMDHSSGRIYEP